MAWLTVGIMAGSALLNARNAEAKRSQQKQYNLAQSELTRYSPWTGMKGQLDNSFNPDSLSAGVGGAIQGASIAQGVNGLFSSPQATTAPNQQYAGSFGDQTWQQQSQSPWSKPNIFNQSKKMMG
ncbi:MAG: hypothetical protein ACK41T_00695 [Pseudobdellovibrio sp.]